MNLQARSYSKQFPALQAELSGRLVKDPATKTGVAFLLVTEEGVTLRLGLDGKVLSGTDTNNVRWSLKLNEPARNQPVRSGRR